VEVGDRCEQVNFGLGVGRRPGEVGLGRPAGAHQVGHEATNGQYSRAANGSSRLVATEGRLIRSAAVSNASITSAHTAVEKPDGGVSDALGMRSDRCRSKLSTMRHPPRHISALMQRSIIATAIENRSRMVLALCGASNG
jgi:hypothetical protein